MEHDPGGFLTAGGIWGRLLFSFDRLPEGSPAENRRIRHRHEMVATTAIHWLAQPLNVDLSDLFSKIPTIINKEILEDRQSFCRSRPRPHSASRVKDSLFRGKYFAQLKV